MTLKLKTEKKSPNPIDIHVGSKVRLRRSMLGLSQEKLGDALGITFQQIQKYEKGTNRVSASKLQKISEVLGAPIEFFFQDAPRSDDVSLTDKSVNDLSEEFLSFMTSKQGVQLNRAFVQIEDPKVRDKALQLVKALAASYKH